MSNVPTFDPLTISGVWQREQHDRIFIGLYSGGTMAPGNTAVTVGKGGLIIHQNEPVRQRARELVNTPEFAKAQRQRTKVKALFAELKNQIELRRLRLRRLKFVREQFFLAAAQNIKRLVRFLSQPVVRLVALAPQADFFTKAMSFPRRAAGASTFFLKLAGT
jgi:hypothetical protein